MSSKVIQIVSAGADKQRNAGLYALCKDGSIWFRKVGNSERFELILPAPEKKKGKK